MYKPLDIRVGQRWRCRDGRIVTVVERLKSGNFLFIDKERSTWLYPPNGKFNIGGDGYELINLVEDVPPCRPEPAPAKPEIVVTNPVTTADKMLPPASLPSLEEITTGQAPFYVLLVEDDSSDGTGGALVWKHPVPKGVTRDAISALQLQIGDRHGQTWIAECRVLPLTQLVPVPVSADQVAEAAEQLTGESEDDPIPFFLKNEALRVIRRFLKQQTEKMPEFD
jgi:hypothetical protein